MENSTKNNLIRTNDVGWFVNETPLAKSKKI